MLRFPVLVKMAAGLFALALLGLVWLAWPFYEFYAHRGEAPMSPFGWTRLPEAPAPATQELFDPAYREAGADALARLQRYRADIDAPSLSAAVAIRGELVWRGAVGWADLEKRRPATPGTIYRIGSTSKAVTGTALARLVDRGVIDLDTSIADYLGELPNPDWAEITPRMLASHMAGLPHYKENTDWRGLYRTAALDTRYDDVREAVEVFDESELLFEPGTDFHYSTLGTVLLGAVMSEAAGKPYRDLVFEEVIEPAGMVSTLVAPATGGQRASAGRNCDQRERHLASFYYREGERYRYWRPVDLSHRLPGGGWASTPSDLVRMGSLHLDTGYISPGTRAAFWTPQRLSSGETNPQDYALGWRWREWEVDGVGLVRNANHGGVSRGSQSWLLVFPDFDMSIAFTMNANTEEFHHFGMLYQELVQAFAPAVGAHAPGGGGRRA